MAKKETHIPAIIDTPEALEAKIAAMKEAQKIFATYTQEQVDKIFKAAATAADKARIPLAKAAVEETGMGIVEDKVIKNHYAAEYIYNAYKNLWCTGRRSGLWNQENCRTDRSDRSSYPDNKPDFHSNLQNPDRSEDKKRNHHQPTSTCKRKHY